MKLKNGYKLVKTGENTSIHFGETPLKKPVFLDKIGVFLWEQLENQDLSSNALLEVLLQNFEISTVLALGEIDTFIKSMKENGIFEE